VVDPVHQAAQALGADRHPVAQVVREAATRRVIP
jgi:hypothetical protein